MKGFLLDTDNDLKITVKKDADGKISAGLVIDEAKLQDAFIVLKLNRGDLKEDPVLGTDLLFMIRSKLSKEKIIKTVKIGLRRAGIDFDEIKKEIELNINKVNIDL